MKKVLSLLIISSLSLGIIGCNKTDDSKNQANKDSKSTIIQSCAKKEDFTISKEDFKNLKTVMNIDITDLLQNNFNSDENIKNVIVAQKTKKEDENKKDVYIFFYVEKDKFNNINNEEISNKALKLISKNKGEDFWKKHNATIFFRTSSTDFDPCSTYITKLGDEKLIKVELK